ncbi:MAG TPA: hypothetical protein VMU02_10885 [bacterium]|nr:hypothetical protein [bacterium]
MRLSVFLFFLALYLATTAGHIYTVDSYLNYNVTKSIATRGAIDIPKFMMTVEGRNGRQYSKLGIGQSLVALPLYWIGSLIEFTAPGGRVFRAYGDRINVPSKSGTIVAKAQDLIKLNDLDGARVFFTMLTCAFLTAFAALVFWSLLRRFGLSRRGALWGTCLLGFATPFWIYSRDFFAEPLFAACLLASLYMVIDLGKSGYEKPALLAGLASSLGILARISFIPICLIFAGYLAVSAGDIKVGSRKAAWYGVGCLPGLIIQGVLDLVRFGDLFQTGYHTAFDKGFSVPLFKGLWWNLASPYRSIFIYAPAVILFAFGFRELLRKRRAEAWLLVAIIVYVFMVYSGWWAWHGGWCWGPRFLLPAIPLLLLPGLVAARTRPRLIALAAGLGAVGFVVNLAGVLINYTAPYDYWIQIGKLDWAENDIQQFSPVAVHLKALTATSPRLYDLWFIQAWRFAGWRMLWPGVGLAAVALLAAHQILRPASKG